MLALFCDTSQPPKTVRGIGDYVDWNCFSLPDCRREQLLTVARRGCFLGVRGRHTWRPPSIFLERVGVLATSCRFRGVVKVIYWLTARHWLSHLIVTTFLANHHPVSLLFLVYLAPPSRAGIRASGCSILFFSLLWEGACSFSRVFRCRVA